MKCGLADGWDEIEWDEGMNGMLVSEWMGCDRVGWRGHL